MIQHNLAIFASGTGTNALNIIKHFKKSKSIRIAFVLCNNPDAPIVFSAAKLNITVIICSNKEVEREKFLTEICENHKVSTIILAGFLRKIPSDLITNYSNKIINIHPALLPKFGGHGMYGKFVHQAVLQHKETETGITIHYVNEEYDKGEIIAQYRTDLDPNNESVESIQQKIHALEMKYFPETIEKTLKK